jgi:hypothetical protein
MWQEVFGRVQNYPRVGDGEGWAISTVKAVVLLHEPD